jgi:hypothetical protein
MQRPCLVVDVLSQIAPRYYYKFTFSSWMKNARRNIKYTSKVAQKRNLQPIYVVDAVRKGEVETKWMERREREVRKGEKGILFDGDIIVSELLLEKKQLVIADLHNNADDVVASWALLSSKESIVLSADKDYFRYGEGELVGRVYCLDKSNQEIEMVQHRKKVSESKKLPFIMNYKSSFVNHASELLFNKLYHAGSFRGTEYSNLFLRGATRPDAELNGKGNLHLAARPYRRQLYTQPVFEIFPYWNGTNVCWVNELVDPLSRASLPDKTMKEFDPVTIAIDLMRSVGGKYNKQHEVTVFLYACELTAHSKKRSSILTEYNRYIKRWKAVEKIEMM